MSIATRFLLLCAAVLALPAIATAQSTPTAVSDLPETIGGHSILAVLTDARTPAAKAAPPTDGTAFRNRPPAVRQPCMRPGEKRLILQSPQPTIEDALRAFPRDRIVQELQALNLTQYAQWGWTVVGPGVTRQQLVKQLKQSYSFFSQHGCAPLKSPIAAAAEPAADNCDASHECWVEPPYQGYAIIQNGDADIGNVNNNAQSVYLVAPKVGNKQDRFSVFLNNVVTDEDCFIWPSLGLPKWEPCFLQVGFYFTGGHGQVVWTDDFHKLEPQDFGITYYTGHTYWTTITHSPGGPWWMCAEDIQDTARYSCKDAPWTSGTHLRNHKATSIFAENWNTNSDWYDGFGEEWKAYGAQIYLNGIGHNWSKQDTWTTHACSPGSWPPGAAIVGSLADGGGASFNTTRIPPKCTVTWPWF